MAIMSSKKMRNFSDESVIPAPDPYKHRFKVVSKVIESAEVYICFDNKLQKEVVLKAEEIGSRKTSNLEKENNFYKKLSENPNFKIVLDYFIGVNHRFLILEKRGLDLRVFYKSMKKANEWKDSFLEKYAVQMIAGLRDCHSFGVLHLDPKPNNYVLDSNDNNKIYLIDFDCGKQYLDSNGQHIPYRKDLPSNEIRGNRTYLSMNGHNCEEQSRRDDMIFLGYSLIWMARGSLPWSNSQKGWTVAQYYQNIKEKKKSYSFQELCQNGGKPLDNLLKYMKYCTELGFYERPDYKYLISLFDTKEWVDREGHSL